MRQRDGLFHLSTQGRTTISHARKTQAVFNSLQSEASKIGMVVNDNKTQLLCMSPSIHRCESYFLTSDGVRVESASSLKLLGFIFDERPSPHAQVDFMVAKFRKRLWSLRYLKRSGMENSDVLAAYITYLRPVLEYGTSAIHSMLTAEQSDLLDKQQCRALKLIYGFDKSTDQVLTLSGLEPLSLRRRKAVDRFALKLVENPRFQHLFPLRPPGQCRSRQSHKYLEYHARTERLYNSPIFYMRRRLNALEENPQVAATLTRSNQSQRCDFIFDEWR